MITQRQKEFDEGGSVCVSCGLEGFPVRETVGGHDALLGEKSSEPYYLAFNKVEVEGGCDV